MKEKDVAGLRVADLKEELKKRGLPLSGLKAALAERLLEALKAENGAEEEKEAEPVEVPGKNDDVVLATAVADDATAEEMKADAPAHKEDAQPAQPAPVPTEPAAAVDDGTETLQQADEKEQEEVKAQQGAEPLPAPAVAAGGPEAAPMLAPAAAPEPAALPVPKVAPRAAEKPQDAGHENGAAQLEESPSPLVRTRDPNAERGEAPAPAAVPLEAAPILEEEVDYEADDLRDAEAAPAAAPAEPAPSEARPRRARSESKSTAAEEAGKGHAGRSKPEREARRERGDGKAAEKGTDKADGSGKRKREPIPVFKTRERRAPEAGEKKEDAAGKGAAAAADGREAKIARNDSASDKRSSVFERLNSKEAAPAEAKPGEAAAAAAAAQPRRAPPTRDAASRALLITGFIRPFTERAAREKLGETGEVAGFWMTKIKDRAYVVYATEAQAEATRNALSGLEWPPGNGNSLRPKFVTLEDAEATIKTGIVPENRRAPIAAPAAEPAAADVKAPVAAEARAPAHAASASAAAAAAAADAAANSRAAAKPKENGAAPAAAKPMDARAILEERRRMREGRGQPAPAKAAAPQAAAPDPMDVDEPKSLDDLFRKTETKPWLYWLPLTEAQAAEKAAAHGKASKPDAALPGPPPAHGK